MNAVIAIAGNQYQVEVGKEYKIEGLKALAGDTIEAPVLLFWDKTEVKVGPQAKKIHAFLRVLKIEKGTKIHVRRYKSKVRHRRHIGFRPIITTVLVEKFSEGHNQKEAK